MASATKLDQLKRDYKERNLTNLRQEKRVHWLELKAQKIVISYLLFETVIFFSVSHSSNISCKTWGIPFSLSLLVTVIFFVTLFDTTKQYLGTRYEYELNLIENQMIQRQICAANSSHQFQIIDIENSPRIDRIVKPDEVKIVLRKIYVYVTFLILLAFATLVALSCRLMLCEDAFGTWGTKSNSHSWNP